MQGQSEPVIQITRGALYRLAALTSIALFIGLGTFLLYQRAAIGESNSDRALPIAAAKVAKETTYEAIEFYAGRIEPRQTVNLAFEQPGKLAKIHVDEGDSVKKGDLIAAIDTALLEASRAQTSATVERIMAQLELARLTEARQKKLFEQGHSTEQRYDEARLNTATLKAQLAEADAALSTIQINIEKAKIYAPFDARVANRVLDDGGVLNAGTTVVTLMETGVQQARISLPAVRVASLDNGASINLYSSEGKPLQAVLSAARPDLNPLTRTQDVLLNVQSDTPLPFGELVELQLVTTRAAGGYWVPVEALVEGRKGLWNVFSLAEDSNAVIVVRRAADVVYAETTRVFIDADLGDEGVIVKNGTHRIVPGQRVQPQFAEE